MKVLTLPAPFRSSEPVRAAKHCGPRISAGHFAVPATNAIRTETARAVAMQRILPAECAGLLRTLTSVQSSAAAGKHLPAMSTSLQLSGLQTFSLCYSMVHQGEIHEID